MEQQCHKTTKMKFSPFEYEINLKQDDIDRVYEKILYKRYFMYLFQNTINDGYS